MTISPSKVARGLAWFGIALGAAELLAPATVARASGLQGRETVLRVFGVREIASGALILAADNPQDRLWVRAAGDALDALLLGDGFRRGTGGRLRVALAAAAVLPVVVLDLLYARKG